MTLPEDKLDRPALAELQRLRLRALVDAALPRNRFYARKFDEAGLAAGDVKEAADLARLPFTTKAELLADQAAHPPYGETHPLPREQYCRLHQTSGTSGRPLRWLDTPESWQGLLDCWDVIYRIAGIGPGDRLFFPFSFGPFLGFWTAFEAGSRAGCLTLPGGGMSSSARLRFLLEQEATVIFCTPTYALHLAETARSEGLDLAGSAVRLLVVAGEPGGSVAATRDLIESAWGARLLDHAGMTEIGPCSIECPENRAGLHIVESHYLAEIINPATGMPVASGQVGELVLTNLVRHGSPLIRYRTGDLVKADPRPCPCNRVFLRLDGGILGRTDDMIHLRGNNVYPSALEAVIRRFPEIAEYRLEVDGSATLCELRVEVEPREGAAGADLAERVGRAIRDELLFRAEVRAVLPGTLPRFEMKARRLVRK
jgi:phenylacetate-CoA ligase